MKHLVLLGAGHAHIFVLARLAQLARKAALPFKVSLIAPYPQQIYSGMLPGAVAGHYRLAQCTINTLPLMAAATANYVAGAGTHIDPVGKRVTIGAGAERQTLSYDVLSVNTGAVFDRQQVERSIPGAREHALFLRPIEAFSPVWDRLLRLAEHRPMRIAIVGGGAVGVELAFAVQYRLPHCAVSLVCGAAGPVCNYPEGVRQRVLGMLRRRGISVLPQSCTGIAGDHLVLDGLTRLTCDATLLAISAQAPPWLENSGLALDPQGFIAVNDCQQSHSHPQVFAAGDVASRLGAPTPKSGVYAIRSAPNLARNLIAAVTGTVLTAYTPPRRTLNLLSCGPRYAIASWGTWSAQGYGVWLWKDWIDRRFMRRYGAQS